MTTGLRTIIYPVVDLDRAKAIYGSLLGAKPGMDEAYYVGFDLDGQHVGLDPHGHGQGMTGPVGYWHVDDIEVVLRQLTDAGATPRQPVTDVGGGKLTATVQDPDGNVIGLVEQR
jgi:predicted enzyme related to lactoylglutathione lyase